MTTKRDAAIGGIGPASGLTLLFIALKLTHQIDWSWWWVLGPVWIPLAAFAGLFAIAFGIIGILAVVWGHR